MHRVIIALVPAALIVLALAPPSLASTFLAMDLAALSRASDLVAVATVTSRRGEPARGTIVTRVGLRLEAVVVGTERAGDEVEIIVAGGEHGGIGVRVSGAPRLELGRRYLLFLQRRGGARVVVGMAQGALPLRAHAAGAPDVVLPAANLPRLVTRRDGRLVEGRPALRRATPLAEVVAAVQEARRAH